jgi:hypothetical protein
MNKKDLTKQEIDKMSLGFYWNPDMSYDEFMKRNKKADDQAWDTIQLRYATYVYEDH